MKIKLTYSEMVALQVIIMYVLTWEPRTISTRLLNSIFSDLDKKVSKKLEQARKRYSLTVKDQEALAFCKVFEGMEPNTGFISVLFESNLILKLTNLFTQHYA